MNFTDISSEQYRVYHFPNGATLRIENPLELNVSRSGGHRLVAEAGCYYIRPEQSWYLFFENRDGHEGFVM